MAAEAKGGDGDPCPVEIAFGGGGIPQDCQVTSHRVRCSPLDHHADLIPASRGIKIAKQCDPTNLKGAGMVTAKNIVQPVYQLKSEFGDRVTAGFFAEVMTPDHDAYPMTVFYGFRMIVSHDEFRFANSVQNKIEHHFDAAEVVSTTTNEMTVLTGTDPFPHQFVDSLRP